MPEMRKVAFTPYGTNNPEWAPLWGLSFEGKRPYRDEPSINYIYLLAKGKAPDSGDVHRKWKDHLPTALVEAYNFRSYVTWFAARSPIPKGDIPRILEDLEKMKDGALVVSHLTTGGEKPLRQDFAADIADFLIPRVISITTLCKRPEFRSSLENINALAGLR